MADEADAVAFWETIANGKVRVALWLLGATVFLASNCVGLIEYALSCGLVIHAFDEKANVRTGSVGGARIFPGLLLDWKVRAMSFTLRALFDAFWFCFALRSSILTKEESGLCLVALVALHAARFGFLVGTSFSVLEQLASTLKGIPSAEVAALLENEPINMAVLVLIHMFLGQWGVVFFVLLRVVRSDLYRQRLALKVGRMLTQVLAEEEFAASSPELAMLKPTVESFSQWLETGLTESGPAVIMDESSREPRIIALVDAIVEGDPTVRELPNTHKEKKAALKPKLVTAVLEAIKRVLEQQEIHVVTPGITAAMEQLAAEDALVESATRNVRERAQEA